MHDSLTTCVPLHQVKSSQNCCDRNFQKSPVGKSVRDKTRRDFWVIFQNKKKLTLMYGSLTTCSIACFYFSFSSQNLLFGDCYNFSSFFFILSFRLPTNIGTTSSTPTAMPLVVISDGIEIWGRSRLLQGFSFSSTVLTPALALGQPGYWLGS